MVFCTDMCGGGADHYGKGLLTPEVSRPFWWGEGIKLSFADICRDSAKQVNLMALTAPNVEKSAKMKEILSFSLIFK